MRLKGSKNKIKKTTDKEAESLKKYQNLVNNLSVGVYRNTPGPHGHFLEANPAIVSMFEADSKKEFLKHNVSELYYDPEKRRLFVKKITKYGFVKNEEIELITLKGRRFIGSITAVMVKNKNGEVYFDGIIDDISERKKMEKTLRSAYGELEARVKERTKDLDKRVAELEDARKAMTNLFEDFEEKRKALAEAKAKDEALLESIGEGVVATDQDGKIIIINKAAEYLLGFSIKEIAGKSFFQSIFLEDAQGNQIPDAQRPIAAALSSGKTVITPSYYLVRRDGVKFPAAITATPVLLNGRAIGAMAVFRDITKEKEIEKLRTDFLSLASHQLRTPLSGTKWLIETVQREITGKLNSKQKEYLNDIYQINERMIKLVSEMLNVLMLESGVAKMEKQEISILKLSEELFLMMEPASKNKGITIRNNLQDQKTLFVFSNFQALRNILESFVSNAINYSQNGQEVVLGAKEEPAVVVFFVKDNGIGIPREEQKRMFERFYRASNAKKIRPNGTGLGLNIAKALAEKIGAEISFESEENKGSVFYLSVPKKVERAASFENKN